VDNNEHYPVLLGRFVIVAPSQTYLLTTKLQSEIQNKHENHTPQKQ